MSGSGRSGAETINIPYPGGGEEGKAIAAYLEAHGWKDYADTLTALPGSGWKNYTETREALEALGWGGGVGAWTALESWHASLTVTTVRARLVGQQLQFKGLAIATAGFTLEAGQRLATLPATMHPEVSRAIQIPFVKEESVASVQQRFTVEENGEIKASGPNLTVVLGSVFVFDIVQFAKT